MTRLEVSLAQGTGLISKGISWFSAGRLSHADLVMPNHTLLGARTDGGVQARPGNYLGTTTRWVFSKEVSGEQAFEVYRYAYKQINKKYDHLAILAFVTNRDWREDDCWFCSELVAACLEVGGVINELWQPLNKITPVMLAVILSADGWSYNRVN